MKYIPMDAGKHAISIAHDGAGTMIWFLMRHDIGTELVWLTGRKCSPWGDETCCRGKWGL